MKLIIKQIHCHINKIEQNSINEIIFSNSTNPASAVDDSSCNKRVKLTSSSFFKGNLQLNEYLKQSAIVRSLLDEYEQKSTSNSSKRSDLLHLIVDGVINNHDMLRGSMTNDLSLFIVELFPNECKEAYYYPPKPNKTSCGGKIMNRYRNITKKYSNRNKTLISPCPSARGLVVTKAMQYKIVWLRSSSEPWKTVEQFWCDTYDQRMSDRSDSGPASEFIEKWPILKNKLGHTLVSSCFLSLYNYIL